VEEYECVLAVAHLLKYIIFQSVALSGRPV